MIDQPDNDPKKRAKARATENLDTLLADTERTAAKISKEAATEGVAMVLCNVLLAQILPRRFMTRAEWDAQPADMHYRAGQVVHDVVQALRRSLRVGLALIARADAEAFRLGVRAAHLQFDADGRVETARAGLGAMSAMEDQAEATVSFTKAELQLVNNAMNLGAMIALSDNGGAQIPVDARLVKLVSDQMEKIGPDQWWQIVERVRAAGRVAFRDPAFDEGAKMWNPVDGPVM